MYNCNSEYNYNSLTDQLSMTHIKFKDLFVAYFEKQNQPNIQHYNVILSGGLLKSCYMRKFISDALTKRWLFRRILVKLVNISEYSNIIMTCSDIYT